MFKKTTEQENADKILEDFQKRFDAFTSDLLELEKKHKIALKPIITQDGPRIIPVQIKDVETSK